MHLHYATNLYLLMSQHATYMTPYSKDQTTVMQRGQMFGKGFLQCLKAFPTVIMFLSVNQANQIFGLDDRNGKVIVLKSKTNDSES